VPRRATSTHPHFPSITHTDFPLVVPCSTIAFTINLHNYHSQTLSQAYQIATRDFIKLRAINEIANFAAEEEAFAYSASSGEGKGAEGSSRKAFVSPSLAARAVDSVLSQSGTDLLWGGT
jgi:hypothetical protein